MLYAGDEVLRTQQGNNNVWCQNNELGWFDWKLVEQNQDLLRFVKRMIAFRKRHACLMRSRFLNAKRQAGMALPDVSWHGVEPHKPLWDDPNAQLLSYTLRAVDKDEEHLHIIFNMSNGPVDVGLPKIDDRNWYRAVDTWRASPQDILAPPEQPFVNSDAYHVKPRSVVVLESRWE